MICYSRKPIFQRDSRQVPFNYYHIGQAKKKSLSHYSSRGDTQPTSNGLKNQKTVRVQAFLLDFSLLNTRQDMKRKFLILLVAMFLIDIIESKSEFTYLYQIAHLLLKLEISVASVKKSKVSKKKVIGTGHISSPVSLISPDDMRRPVREGIDGLYTVVAPQSKWPNHLVPWQLDSNNNYSKHDVFFYFLF